MLTSPRGFSALLFNPHRPPPSDLHQERRPQPHSAPALTDGPSPHIQDLWHNRPWPIRPRYRRPRRGQFGQVRHFLAGNYNNNNGDLVNTTAPITAWFQPSPGAGNPAHRYVFWAFKQSPDFNQQRLVTSQTFIGNWNLSSFTSQTGLGNPVAATFMLFGLAFRFPVSRYHATNRTLFLWRFELRNCLRPVCVTSTAGGRAASMVRHTPRAKRLVRIKRGLRVASIVTILTSRMSWLPSIKRTSHGTCLSASTLKASSTSRSPKPKAAPKPKDDDEEEPDVPAEPKAKNPLDDLPKSTLNLEDWKRAYSNKETRGADGAIEWFYANYDPAGYSVWRVDFKYNDELTQTFMSANQITGFFNRLEASRKYIFGSVGVLGETNNSIITGVFIARGQDIEPVVNVAPDWESYSYTKLDLSKDEDKKFFEGALAWDLEVDGKKWVDGKNLK
ncbi:hypothetical protein NMY22_g17381 [Coprinellus aureogranulatus]|nr:hypothetical protein NMY22_g17381 [Coprinellus aureogranulatus]